MGGVQNQINIKFLFSEIISIFFENEKSELLIITTVYKKNNENIITFELNIFNPICFRAKRPVKTIPLGEQIGFAFWISLRI